MAARERRERKHVERLGNYADNEALGELDLGSEAEEEGSDVEEARGAVAKAARRGGGARAAPRQTAVTADMLSTLLAGAPALVDCLLLEDSVRSITLCCRDVVNLNIAAGGGVNLEPVWEALASHVKAKAAAAAAAAAEQAAQAAEAGAAPEQLGNPEPGAPAAPAPAVAVPAAAAAPAVPAPAPAAEPEPAGRRTRRGRAKKAKTPPEPSALDVVKAAVAADPARSKDVRKTTAQWVYKISQKAVHALPTHKGEWGKTLYCYELDVRTLAWRRWGDQARMDAAKHRAEEQEQQRRKQYEQRLQEEKEARQEELAIRLAENRLPPDTAEVQINYRLRDWVRWGSQWLGTLDELLAPIIERHQARLDAEEKLRLRAERTKLLDDTLEAEGLQFFKRDWRYRCFVAIGDVDGIDSLLGTARRQQLARQAEGERHRELAERLDAAGLEFYHSTSPMFAEWLKTGEGDIETIVQQRRLRVDRECQLQLLLEINGLLHRQNSERCKKFVTGELLHRSGAPYTAKEVVSSLLASLGNEHTRCQELLDRLREERLPPVMHLSWCQTFVTAGGDLDAIIYQVKEYVYSRADVGVPPPGRPWAAAHDSTGAHIGIAAPAPPAGLPTALCMLNSGHPVYVYNEIRPEGPTRVAFICSVPPGTSVTGLGVQLLDGSGAPAAAVVAGELSVTWQDGWQDVTWDAPAAAASAAGAVIRLPPIQAPDAAGGMRHESIRFISSSPPLDLSLAVCIKAGLPALPSRPASDEAAECKDAAAEDGKEGSRPLDLYWLEAAVEAAAEAAEALEEDAADRFAAEASEEPEGSSQRGDGTSSLAAGGVGSEQDAGLPLLASVAAEPAVEAAAAASAPAAPAKDDAAAEAEAAAGAAVLADAGAASSPAPLGAAEPGLQAAAEEPQASSLAAAPPAAAAAVQERVAAGSDEEQEPCTVDEMAVEAAAEQAAAGGETPFFSAEEAMAATAAKALASQPPEGGQTAPQQGQQDEDGPAAMQE